MGQSALCFLRGRSSKFSSVFRYLSNHVEVNIFYLISVWFIFVFIWPYRTSGLPNIFGYYLWILSFLWWRFFFLFFVLRYFVSGVCLSIYVFVSCHLKLGVPGPWEFSLAGRVIYFLCVWLRRVECRAGTSFSGHYPGVDGGTAQIFPFSGSVVAGTVRLKWWGGVVFLSSCFL